LVKKELSEEEKDLLAVREYFRKHPIKDGREANAIMRQMMAELLNGSLESELDESLGYTIYDYKNKHTDNSRTGSYNKTLHTSLRGYGYQCTQRPQQRVRTDCR
jgi:transposase-like protein